MRQLLAGVAAAALMCSPLAAPHLPFVGAVPAQAQDAEVSISVFFDGLREHGSWVSHPRHRYVWVPTDVDAGWVPYSNGRWTYTEQYGWYFVSEEPFAWAVYHYGRWAYDPDIGWFWVPGTRWAPAWVSWRRGGDHVGWAPLPPEGDGFVVSVEVVSAEPPPGYWVFVPVREFTAPDLTIVIVEREEVPVLYERTEVLGPVVIENDIVINNVIDIDFVQEHVDEEIEVTQVQMVTDPSEAAGSDTPVAFSGEIAVEEDATPAEAMEATEVEAPTEGQDVTAEEAPAGTMPGDEAAPGEEAPTEDQPEGGAPAEGDPAGEAPAEEAPVDEQPAETAPDDAGSADEAPAEEQPADGAPADGQPAEEQPADEAPAEGAPAEEQPADQAPAQEAPADEAPAEEAPEEAVPAEEAPAEEAPADEAPADAEPADDAQEEAAPAEEAPAEECAPEDRQAGRC